MVYDDIDDDDDVLIDEPSQQEESSSTDSPIDKSSQQTTEESSEEQEIDIIATLLNDRGIKDLSKLSFEDESGNTIERSWDDLTSEEQLQVLRSSTPAAEDGLDESEIQLVNSYRQSNLTLAEYIQYIQNQAVENYKKSIDETTQEYTVDQYSDDELYVLDLINRTGITQEEAEQFLETAKANESVFNKQITTLRTAYKQQEEEMAKYEQYQSEQKAQEEYNKFAQSIYDSVGKFQPMNGNIDMDSNDRSQLYEFLTGQDNAGNNWFRKALQDPEAVTKMAWYLLYGDQAFWDVQNYYGSQIMALKKDLPKQKPISNIIYKPKSNKPSDNKPYYDDLDDDI